MRFIQPTHPEAFVVPGPAERHVWVCNSPWDWCGRSKTTAGVAGEVVKEIPAPHGRESSW